MSRTRAHYREIQDSSYETYARLIQQMCTFVFRSRTTSDLPSSALEFPRSHRQDEAFGALWTFASQDLAYEAPCDKQNASVDELLFEILESIFYVKLIPVSGIACLTDLMLMLLWLRDDGSAVMPTTATHYCAIIQYWGFTTVIHTLRLYINGLQPRYLEHNSSSPSSNVYDEDKAESIVKCVMFPSFFICLNLMVVMEAVK